MDTPFLTLSGVAVQIDAVLPQTQCTRCGYSDCAHYAEAVSMHCADIDQCPPGGAEGVRRIAAVLQQPSKPLNPVHGIEAPRTLAFIDEDWCIGCTLCLDACPVDAILGASKRMHTVVSDHCTGCELCIPVCPVDCIELVDAGDGNATGWAAWSPAKADTARERYSLHQIRYRRTELFDCPRETVEEVSLGKDASPIGSLEDAKQKAIQLVMAKARNRSSSF